MNPGIQSRAKTSRDPGIKNPNHVMCSFSCNFLINFSNSRLASHPGSCLCRSIPEPVTTALRFNVCDGVDVVITEEQESL